MSGIMVSGFQHAVVAADAVPAPLSPSTASSNTGRYKAGLPRAWLRYGRKWIADHFPPLDLTGESDPACVSGVQSPAQAVIHLHNGERLVVAVDKRNEAYFYRCLQGLRDAARVSWFETIDGCLVGLNIAQVNVVFWGSERPTTPRPTECNPDQLAVHFADKASITLPRISDTQIEQLREATVSRHRARAFFTLRGQRGDPVSISLQTMTYISMPAAWVDHGRFRWSRA
jgi:hypothetical protein